MEFNDPISGEKVSVENGVVYMAVKDGERRFYAAEEQNAQEIVESGEF